MIREHALQNPWLRRFALTAFTLAAVAVAMVVYFQYINPAGAAVTTLYAINDRTNAGGWQNQSAVTCNGMVSTACSASIDEDIDAPIDSDYTQSPVDAVNAIHEFDVLDAPVDMSALSAISVRYRALKTGTKAATVKVDVIDENNAIVGSPLTTTLTGSATTYSYNITGLNLTQAQTDSLFVRITGAVSGAGTSTRVQVTDVNLDLTYSTVANNPVLPQTCGIDIVLVMDTSGSIDGTELTQMKNAYNGFIDALLPGTPTQMAIVDFDTAGFVAQGFTASAASLHTAVNAAVADGLTNWEDGLRDARGLFPNRADKPDLIIFASDGDPNTIGTNGFTSFVGEGPAVHAAIVQADLAKNAGIRIQTLGIGTDPNVSNLESISSFDATTTTNFMQLEDDLFDLAVTLCGGTVSVHKLIDADGNPGTTGDQTSQAGWIFNANVTSAGDSSTPPSGATDGSGYILFDISLGGDQMATLNVVETVQPGYAVIAANCIAVGNGPLGTWNNGNAVNSITLGVLDIAQCTFINSLQKPFVVNKDFQPNNAASVNVTLSCATGTIAPVGPTPVSESSAGNFTVTGYTGDPVCTATESPIPAGYDSSGTCSATLNAGSCTIVNVLRTATINVAKDFSDNNVADVNIAVACTSGTVTPNDTTASEADTANFTVSGFNLGTTCNASESVPAGYTGNQTNCQNLAISPGGTTNCTMVNTLNSAMFTVNKDFTPDNFVISVTITVTCTSGTVAPASAPAMEGSPAVFTITGFTAGATCTATESAPPGYNGNQSGCANVAIVPGGSHSCTIFNTAVTATFLVNKDFDDNNAMSVTVSLTCTSGTVSPSSASASESSPANFTVFAYVGSPTCTATETIPAGYNSSGTCSGPLLPATGQCTITNTYIVIPLPFTVFKDFTDGNPQNISITLACAPGAVFSVVDPTASESDPADFLVYNTPGTVCTATEAVPFGYTGNQTNCQNVPLLLASCLMVNTPKPLTVGGVVDVTIGGAIGGDGSSAWVWLAVLGAMAVASLSVGGFAYQRRRS